MSNPIPPAIIFTADKEYYPGKGEYNQQEINFIYSKAGSYLRHKLAF